MAVWQYDCALVAPRHNRDSSRDESRNLRNVSAVELLAELDSLGAYVVAWCSSIRRWGPEDGTCVLLTQNEDGDVEDLEVRVDMRSPNLELLRKVLAVASRHKLQLLTEDGEVLEPELKWLMQLALQSSASRFLRDPESFLEQLGQEHDG